ncbi:FkbM family methyltransferase [Pseudoroseomonas cervicalis]|uniref:FkbM family methyltransferase n=1 Tax=Teichococcus cervicalis TaxID=204525 RepID=UPI002784D288|nr:FkbM family methyltransferase [Pseudoroseomonas cervicalis]MDQ1078310.1 FkbM family methyltransferase [Pseudoroseomonas cervicalis]
MVEDEQVDRIAQLEERLDRMEALLTRKLDRMTQRLEEIGTTLQNRTARLVHAQAVYLGDHTALTFLESGQRIYVDTLSRDIGVHLLAQGRWESQTMALFRRLVRPGDHVLDIGANHGIYALQAAQATGPTGQVHAFEPNPRLAELAAASLAANAYSWAKLHPVAVGDVPGEAELTFNPKSAGGGNIHPGRGPAKAERLMVKMVALDQFFPDPSFHVDVIKMDIEGYEGRALRGMAGLLERSPDLRMIMEFSPALLARGGVKAPEVAAQLQALGLQVWKIDGRGQLEARSWDWVAGAETGLTNLLVAREAPAA